MSNRILAQGVETSNDTWVSGRNNNDLIVGPSGSGKTRGYVIPNILQANESMIITDTKHSLRQQTGPILERQGYQVCEIDLTDCIHSPWGYNPLSFIRHDADRGTYNEQDIITATAVLAPITNGHDKFWDLITQNFIESLIGYTLEFLPHKEHNMTTVVKLFREMGTGRLDKLMDEAIKIDPNSFAAIRYQMFETCHSAEKMHASVMGIASEKLSPLTFAGVKTLFDNPRQIDFSEMGRRKTALFLNISDVDRSMDRLAALLYSQAQQCLINEADQRPEKRLTVPVRLILDDFAASAVIPDFDKIISVVRSREISCSIIVQSLSQLEALYGYNRATTIINNCDNMLYLGGGDVETARYFATKANKSIHTILDMPLDAAYLFQRGLPARQVQKYDLTQHPNYHELTDAHTAAREPERSCGGELEVA